VQVRLSISNAQEKTMADKLKDDELGKVAGAGVVNKPNPPKK
jgi:hypothetical protein